MPEQRSFIENFTPRDRNRELVGTMRIRPVVVDSSFFISEVLRSTRSHHQTTFLSAVKSGVLRPFAAQHVWAEVPRELAGAARGLGLDADLAGLIWWQEYVPRIRFVDTGGLSTANATALLARDPTDVPTAALAGLLTPVVVLSSDADLQDTGFAVQKYYRVVEAAGSLTIVADGTWASMAGLQIVGSAATAAARSIATLARRREGQVAIALVVGAIIVAALIRGSRLRDDGRHLGKNVGGFLRNGVYPFVETMAAVHASANSLWDDAAYVTDAGTLQQRVARLLAVSPNSLSRTQIAGLMVSDAVDTERRRLMRDLASVLGAVPAFSAASKRRWELGRAGMDFGGVGNAVSDLLRIDPGATSRHLRSVMDSSHRRPVH
jgi:hypothetical protein